MSDLNIYKASAGSGKTFTLAVEYIKLLIASPKAYQHILAVTFTNKATDEMKERILSQLYGIAMGLDDSKSYLNRICEDLNLSAQKVREGAQSALLALIHDYSRFQVTTIDSFFQMVIRNLARELGLGAGLNIELDTESTLSHAVDKLIERLDTQSSVYLHLLDYIHELIADDKSWKVIDSIKDFGKHIFSEEFMTKRKELLLQLDKKENISAYKKLLNHIARKAEEPLQDIAKSFFERLQQTGLDYTSFKWKARGVGNYFKKLSERNYDDSIRNSYVTNCLGDINEWRSNENRKVLTDSQLVEMQSLLSQAESIRPEVVRILNSCNLSLKHLNKVALLTNIDNEVHEYNNSSNRFLLAESNILLGELVKEGDSSFIFEKIGSSLRHIMIDEFQDTSRLQWQNFRKLLIEGLSQGADSLIVGDVKQAIYRWRNGDWSILAGLQTKLDSFNIRQLTDGPTINRRSEENIIKFNNAFFSHAEKLLSARYKAEEQIPCQAIEQAYEDVCQEFDRQNRTPGKGYVKVEFLEDQKEAPYVENTLKAMVKETRRLLSNGIPPHQIAILVRKNKFIPVIADYFEREMPDIPIVSSEAYRLDASKALLTLILALRLLTRPQDKISMTQLAILCNWGNTPFEWEHFETDYLKAMLPHTFIEQMDGLRTLPLYELLEELVDIFKLNLIKGEEAYLFSFFDAVTEYLGNNPADYDSFLRHWDEKLCAKTIPAGSLDGIQIYSIHKSKGLEFHTVLIPFCSWKMENEQQTHTVWCTPAKSPYDQISLLPINYGHDMDLSIYHNDYLKEKIELWVDNLNTLYVAFTRATANLIVWGCAKDNGFTASSLIKQVLPMIQTDKSSTEVFEMGDICPYIGKKSKKSDNPITAQPQSVDVPFVSYHQPLNFRQSNKAATFIQGDEQPDQQELYRRQGILLHYLFSAIHTVDDIPTVLQQMEMEGLFHNQLSKERIQKIIDHALKNPMARNWFSPGWDLFNERTIISRTEAKAQSKRPDRVMLSSDHKQAIVIDFKFAAPDPQKHQEQVSNYMELLTRMGYAEVKGYVWYVYTGKIDPVNPLT